MTDIYLYDFVSSPQQSWKWALVFPWINENTEGQRLRLPKQEGAEVAFKSTPVWPQSLYLYNYKYRWESSKQTLHLISKYFIIS